MSGLGALPGGAGALPSSVTPLQFLVAQVNRFADPKTPVAFRFLDGVGGTPIKSPPKAKGALDPGDPEDRRLALVVAAITQRREAEAFTQGLSDGEGFDFISDFLANVQNTITGKPGAPISSVPRSPSVIPIDEGGGFSDPVAFVNRQIPAVATTVQGFADSLGLPKARISIFGDIPMVAIGAVAIGGAVALFWWSSKRKGKR